MPIPYSAATDAFEEAKAKRKRASEMANREKREPEFDGGGAGAVERMIAKDKDGGKKLSNRATAYDALTRGYLRVLKAEA